MSTERYIQIFATVGVSTALLNLALMLSGVDVRKVDAVRGTVIVLVILVVRPTGLFGLGRGSE